MIFTFSSEISFCFYRYTYRLFFFCLSLIYFLSQENEQLEILLTVSAIKKNRNLVIKFTFKVYIGQMHTHTIFIE